VSEKQSTGIKGGKRPGAGRKPGVPNKRTAEVQAAVEASGVTPLDFMLNVMRSEPPPGLEGNSLVAAMSLRFEAAKAAAPYVHAKLAAVEVTGKDGGPLETVSRVELVSLDDSPN
jgi:hypothetical protein